MEERCYQQLCGVARALDVVGERWTLLIMRDLLLGPRRYTELLESLRGLTTNLLARRLKQLEAVGLIEKRRERGQTAYTLSPAGAALEPAIMELGRWGASYGRPPRPGDRGDIGWVLISLKRRYKGGARMTVGIRADDRIFELCFESDYLRVLEGAGATAPLVISGTKEAWLDLLIRGVRASGLIEREALALQGQARLWPRFLATLALPS